jgi:hypothetical protein
MKRAFSLPSGSAAALLSLSLTFGSFDSRGADVAITNAPASASAGGKVTLAGVRSSAYGIRPFPSPEGWGKAMTTMSGYFPDSKPFAIWIVGRLNGGIQGVSLEFPRPEDGKDYGTNIAFADTDKHEPYLKHFDELGIKVFLQVEPGYADVETLIDLVLNRYKHHPSVIGWGIDVEWYNNARTGSPNAIATDEVVKVWDAKMKAHNPGYRLLVKHFRVNNLPQMVRGDMVFCCNSQMYSTVDDFVRSYKRFADSFYPSMVAFQIGYPRDKTWWGQLDAPVPKTLGERLAAEIRQEIALAWVDFGMRDVLPAD